MKVIETRPRVKGFVLWGHCQNLLDDPRITMKIVVVVIMYQTSIVDNWILTFASIVCI